MEIVIIRISVLYRYRYLGSAALGTPRFFLAAAAPRPRRWEACSAPDTVHLARSLARPSLDCPRSLGPRSRSRARSPLARSFVRSLTRSLARSQALARSPVSRSLLARPRSLARLSVSRPSLAHSLARRSLAPRSLAPHARFIAFRALPRRGRYETCFLYSVATHSFHQRCYKDVH